MAGSQSCERGFTLVEAMVATALLATAVVALAQLFGLATRSNIGSRNTTYAVVLAGQKLEQLISDAGLSPSAASALQEVTAGFVDHVDRFGNELGGGTVPPPNTAYTRRWSVQPLPNGPSNTLVIQVLVTRYQNRGAADEGAVGRLPEEARLVTVKTRQPR